MLAKIKTFVKKEAVLCISALCAVITMFLVPPSAEYIEYIDFRVLCLLFSLMGVVAGFKSVGAFKWLTYQLLRRILCQILPSAAALFKILGKKTLGTINNTRYFAVICI